MPRVVRSSSISVALVLLASLVFGQQGMPQAPAKPLRSAIDPVLQHWSAPTLWSAPAPLSIESPTIAAPVLYSFVAISPCRQYNSLSSTPLPQGSNRTVTLSGAPCGIPAGAAAVSANITVFNITGATGNGVFKVDIVSPPTIAWINYPSTEAQRANAGTVALDGSGHIVVQVAQGGGQVDFIVDVNGYYTLPPTTLTAFVDSGGALTQGVHVVSATNVNPGVYEVVFDRVINGCVWVVPLGNPGANPIPNGYAAAVLQTGNGAAVLVGTRGDAGTSKATPSESSCTAPE